MIGWPGGRSTLHDDTTEPVDFPGSIVWHAVARVTGWARRVVRRWL